MGLRPTAPRAAASPSSATSAKDGLPAEAHWLANQGPSFAKPTEGSLRTRCARRRLEHPQGRAPCFLPYQGSPSLSTGWMRWPAGRSFSRRLTLCPPMPCLRRATFVFAALGEGWSKRKDLHLRSPSGHRVYSAPHLLLFVVPPALRAPARLTHSLRSGLRHLRASRSVCHASKRLGARAGFAPATVSL